MPDGVASFQKLRGSAPHWAQDSRDPIPPWRRHGRSSGPKLRLYTTQSWRPAFRSSRTLRVPIQGRLGSSAQSGDTMSMGAEGSEKGGSAHGRHAAARELQGLGTRPWIHVWPLHHSRDHRAVTKSRNELTRRIQSHTASTGLTAQPRPVLPSISPQSFTQRPRCRPGTPHPNTLASPHCQNFPSENQRHTLQISFLPAGRPWGLVPFWSPCHQPPAPKGQRTPTASFPRAYSSDDQNLLSPTWGRLEEAQVPTGARWAKETHL